MTASSCRLLFHLSPVVCHASGSCCVSTQEGAESCFACKLHGGEDDKSCEVTPIKVRLHTTCHPHHHTACRQNVILHLLVTRWFVVCQKVHDTLSHTHINTMYEM